MYSDQQTRDNIRHFRLAMSQAVAYRLKLAQRETGNHQFIENRLSNLWESASKSYQQKAWEAVLGFREALQPTLDLRGYWKQSLMLNDWACEGAQVLGDRLSVIRWTHDRADILHQQGNYIEAARLYQTCEKAYRAIGEHAMALRSRHMRSLVLRAQGRSAEARQLCETTITEAKQRGLNDWLAHPLYVMGLLLRDQGSMRQAEACIEKSIALLTAQPAPQEEAMIAQCYHFLGETALRQDDRGKARTYLMHSLQLSQQVGIIRRVVATQRVLGDLARMENDFTAAEGIYDEAFDTASKLEDRPELAKLHFARAKLLMQRDTKTATHELNAAYATFQEIGDARGMAGVSLLLARSNLQHMRLLKAVPSFLRAMKIIASLGLSPGNLSRFWGWWLFRTRI